MTVTTNPNVTGAGFSGDQTTALQALVSGACIPTLNDASAGTAAAMTALLQASLNAAGKVRWMGNGTVWISDTLVIYSDTELTVDPGLTVKMISGAGGKPVLQNYAYSQRANKVAVTWAWAAGTAATVAWPNHGLAVGDCAWLQGSTLSAFNLIAMQLASNSAATASDVNTMAIDLNYVPSGAQAGSATALKCDRNITINCLGLLDYNQPANTTGGSNLFSCGVHLSLISNLRVNGLRVANAEKFALVASGLRDAVIQGINCPVTKSDVLHMYGPLQNVQVLGVSGNCGDDGVIVQPYESPAYPNFQWTRGDCIGVRVRGTDLRSRLVGASIAVCYPNDVDKCIDISFEDIGGWVSQGNAVAVVAGSSASDFAESIYVNGVSASCRYGLRLGRQSSYQLTIRNISCNASNFSPRIEPTNGIPVFLDAGVSLYSGDIGVNINDPAFNGGVNAVQIAGTYEHLIVRGSIAGGATCRGIGIMAAQTGHLVVSGMTKHTGDQLVGGNVVSGTITLQNCDTGISNVLSPSGVSGAVTVNLVGNRFNNASGGVVRATTGTYNIRESGNDFAGSTVAVLAPAGTPTFNVYGLTMPVDIGATGFNKTLAGQMAFNTAAGRGTIAQNRLVTCNGTNWVQVDAPANTF